MVKSQIATNATAKRMATALESNASKMAELVDIESSSSVTQQRIAEINSAKETAITAIQTKVDSFESYAQVNEDITQLKGQLNGITFTITEDGLLHIEEE